MKTSLFIWLSLATCLACQPGASTDAGTTPSPPPPPSTASGPAICLLPEMARGIASGKAWTDNITQSAAACGTNQDTAVRLWSAHAQAESIEGFTPRTTGGGKP